MQCHVSTRGQCGPGRWGHSLGQAMQIVTNWNNWVGLWDYRMSRGHDSHEPPASRGVFRHNQSRSILSFFLYLFIITQFRVDAFQVYVLWLSWGIFRSIHLDPSVNFFKVLNLKPVDPQTRSVHLWLVTLNRIFSVWFHYILVLLPLYHDAQH